MPQRILIVDDHAIVRSGVKTLLSGSSDWEICGEAKNGREAIEKVEKLAPDVVLLDLTMPEMNGFQAAPLILEKAPAIKIVFFSMHEVPTSGRLVGAHGFVSKSSAEQDLVATLEYVCGLRGTSQKTDLFCG